MIVFGWKGVAGWGKPGQFYCPTCRAIRPYQHKTVRRFFTLYFVPVIPLDKVGEYVECGVCRGQFKPEALAFDPGKAEEDFKRDLVRILIDVLATLIRLDGSDAKLLAGQSALEEMQAGALAPYDLAVKLKMPPIEMLTIVERLVSMEGQLSDAGKESLLKAAIRVAIADGPISHAAAGHLAAFAKALRMSLTHLRGIAAECGAE